MVDPAAPGSTACNSNAVDKEVVVLAVAAALRLRVLAETLFLVVVLAVGVGEHAVPGRAQAARTVENPSGAKKRMEPVSRGTPRTEEEARR